MPTTVQKLPSGRIVDVTYVDRHSTNRRAQYGLSYIHLAKLWRAKGLGELRVEQPLYGEQYERYRATAAARLAAEHQGNAPCVLIRAPSGDAFVEDFWPSIVTLWPDTPRVLPTRRAGGPKSGPGASVSDLLDSLGLTPEEERLLAQLSGDRALIVDDSFATGATADALIMLVERHLNRRVEWAVAAPLLIGGDQVHPSAIAKTAAVCRVPAYHADALRCVLELLHGSGFSPNPYNPTSPPHSLGLDHGGCALTWSPRLVNFPASPYPYLVYSLIHELGHAHQGQPEARVLNPVTVADWRLRVKREREAWSLGWHVARQKGVRLVGKAERRAYARWRRSRLRRYIEKLRQAQRMML